MKRFKKIPFISYKVNHALLIYHFTIHTDIEVSPQFYGWVCGLGRGVRILAPAEVVEEMGNYVKGIAEMY